MIKSLATKIILGLTLCSTQAYCFTPALQASIFNASFHKLDFTKQEKIIGYTSVLYGTLNNDERTSLIGHPSLRVASYMYLVEMWQTYSLSRILKERGIEITEQQIKDYNLSEKIIQTQLQFVGPLNYPLRDNGCNRASNETFSVDYIKFLSQVERLQYLARDLPDSQAMKGALLYIKAFYFQRLHTPNSTATSINAQCLSDVNGLLTCADPLLVDMPINQERLDLVRSYQKYDLNEFGVDEETQNTILSCKINMWYYAQSGGLIEPINDGETISSSEALLSNLNGDIIEQGKVLNINTIIQENLRTLDMMYFPSQYQTKNGQNAKAIIPGALLRRIQLAALRGYTLLNLEADLQ